MATEFLKDGRVDKMFAKEKQEIIERQVRRYIETQEMLALEKPFRGIISDFIITEAEENAPHGRVMGHLGDRLILTSPIVTLGEFMVETLNSTYELRGR